MIFCCIQTRLSCADFATRVVLPFVMKQPLALLGAPMVYALKNSFGAGIGVDGILAEYAEIDKVETVEAACDALREQGRGIDHAWLAPRSQLAEGPATAAIPEIEELRKILKDTVYLRSVSLGADHCRRACTGDPSIC